MRHFILLLLSLPLCAGDSALPADAQAVLSRLIAAEAVERAKLDASVLKLRAEAIKQLETALTAQTKAGNLDAAIKLRDKIAELNGPATAAIAVESAQKTAPTFENRPFLASDWNGLQMATFGVSAKEDTEIPCPAGNFFIYPHPVDTWDHGVGVCNYEGINGAGLYGMQVRTLDGTYTKVVPGMKIETRGNLYFKMNDKNYSDNKGKIRVKVK